MNDNRHQAVEQAPRVYTIAEFCRLYAISRSQVYREAGAGKLPIRKSGTRSLIARDDAETWFAALPVATMQTAA